MKFLQYLTKALKALGMAMLMTQFADFETTKCSVPCPASWYSMNGTIAIMGRSSEAPSETFTASGVTAPN